MPIRTRFGLFVVVAVLCGCSSGPPEVARTAVRASVPATVLLEASDPVEADDELLRLWDDVTSPDYLIFARASREIVRRGTDVLPFLASRIDDRRMVFGQRVPVAQGLIGQVLDGLEVARLEELASARSPVIRYEAVQVLGRRGEAEVLRGLPHSTPGLSGALEACRARRR